MTRKKAIEAAIEAAMTVEVYSDREFFEVAANQAFEAGRIAGLREAARMTRKHRPSLSAAWLYGEIRDHARALAKKARGK